jgi:hypothetical protein
VKRVGYHNVIIYNIPSIMSFIFTLLVDSDVKDEKSENGRGLGDRAEEVEEGSEIIGM